MSSSPRIPILLTAITLTFIAGVILDNDLTVVAVVLGVLALGLVAYAEWKHEPTVTIECHECGYRSADENMVDIAESGDKCPVCQGSAFHITKVGE